MVRFTWAPSLVWFCTCQRNRSPTLRCTMSYAEHSILLWVPLPLPCTPMITYLRIDRSHPQGSRCHAAADRGGVDAPSSGDPEHVLLGDQHGGVVINGAG